MKIGVCYYPEHWPETRWQQDAEHMRALGISVVRVGEFAWSRLEAEPGQYTFEWLERAINTLHSAGLKVVLGTPTATPPIWIVNKHPDMLAIDEFGRTRGFGSRRHYCFSSEPYKKECVRIVTKLAKHFGKHEAITAWQTDNEFGCHSTTISYSPAAVCAFQQWCSEQYNGIEALNEAWGNVFWSMEYNSFSDIQAPVGAVTETNPAHRLAYWRFSSDQVAVFNRLQSDILRTHSPGRDIIHNFMGNFVEFDHFDVSADLDVASWDNYPLGFLTRDGANENDKQTFFRTGDPDSSSFHHELYYACGRGRMWVMEQQPGPVNWAPYNPAPVPGMVRLWGWEAYLHGAEVVSYFRWRQAPFAQEQMHAGLCLPNGAEDDAAHEVKIMAAEIDALASLDLTKQPADVAVLFDYAGDQASRIQQPDGENYDPLVFTQLVYSSLRQLGVMVDVVGPTADLSAYKLIVLPNCTVSNTNLVDRLKATNAHIVLMPRAGSKTEHCNIPDQLPPGAFQQLINVQVTRVETLPSFAGMTTNKQSRIEHWRERVAADFPANEQFDDGWGFHYQAGRVHYINACPDRATLLSLFAARLTEIGIAHTDLGRGLRVSRRGQLLMAFNYGPEAVQLDKQFLQLFNCDTEAGLVLGQRTLNVGSIVAWKYQATNSQ